MHDANSAHHAVLRDLEAVVAGNLPVAPASMKLLHQNCQGNIKRYVFEARFPNRNCCALKCFLHTPDEGGKRAVEKEAEIAEWAAQQQLGVPIHGVLQGPRTTILVMAKASTDFERLLQSCHRLPYALVKELFLQAFRLASHERLIERRLVCADLKPANFLVHAAHKTYSVSDLADVVKRGDVPKGCRFELRLADFDPFFWSEVSDDDVVALLNTFVLLANCALWKTAIKLGPYLPSEALKLAAAVQNRESSLVRALTKHRRLLSRGPFYYSRIAGGQKASLEAFLTKLSEALTYHGL